MDEIYNAGLADSKKVLTGAILNTIFFSIESHKLQGVNEKDYTK